MLKPIHSETDYKHALAEVSALIDANPRMGSDECDRLEILAALVETYERDLVDMRIRPAATPSMKPVFAIRRALHTQHIVPARYQEWVQSMVLHMPEDLHRETMHVFAIKAGAGGPRYKLVVLKPNGMVQTVPPNPVRAGGFRKRKKPEFKMLPAHKAA